MAYGRREIAPSDQIKALRHARDQYVQLADRIHNDVDPALDDAEKQSREDNARRIAKAYDRSLSNSVARLSGMERTHRPPTQSFGLWYRIGVLLILVLACALPFTYRYIPAATLNRVLSLRDAATVASPPAQRTPPAKIPAPAIIEQSPPPEKPEVPKNLEMAAQKPAIAVAAPVPAPAPAKVAQPPAPAAKKPVVKPREEKRETAKAKPAAAKPVAPKTPEVAKAAIPVPAEPPRPATLTTVAPAAPLPAPVETPSPAAPPAPQVAAVSPAPAVRPPEPIMETHTQPPYPTLSARAGETGTTKINVAISPLGGQVTDCRITQTSGSDRLDRAACAHVTNRWRWKPTSRDGAAPAPRITVTVVWNLRRPTPTR